MNWWGCKTNGEEYGHTLQFLKWNKEKVDWENDVFGDNDKLVEEAPITHPTLLAELPGIVEESDFIDDDAPVKELALVDDAILATQAAANANLTTTTGVLHELTGATNG